MSNQRLPSKEDLDYVLTQVGSHWKNLDGKAIFISGATGIIGKWLLATLHHAQNTLGLTTRIVALSRAPTTFAKNYPDLIKSTEWIQGDVREFSFVSGQSFEWAIHAATDVVEPASPETVLLTCSTGTENLVRQLAGANCKRLLLLSSGAVYGKVPQDMTGIPETFLGGVSTTNPESAYAEGKRYAELLCTLLSSRYAMTIPIARCFAMVGPYLPLDRHFAIGNFIDSVLKNTPIIIKGDGTPIRSYMYIADVVSRLWLLLFKGRNTAYNVGSSEPISIRDLAQLVRETLNSDIPIQIENLNLHGVHANRYYPNIHLMNQDLMLNSIIPLKDAILRTANWHTDYKSIV